MADRKDAGSGDYPGFAAIAANAGWAAVIMGTSCRRTPAMQARRRKPGGRLSRTDDVTGSLHRAAPSPQPDGTDPLSGFPSGFLSRTA